MISNHFRYMSYIEVHGTVSLTLRLLPGRQPPLLCLSLTPRSHAMLFLGLRQRSHACVAVVIAAFKDGLQAQVPLSSFSLRNPDLQLKAFLGTMHCHKMFPVASCRLHRGGACAHPCVREGAWSVKSTIYLGISDEGKYPLCAAHPLTSSHFLACRVTHSQQRLPERMQWTRLGCPARSAKAVLGCVAFAAVTGHLRFTCVSTDTSEHPSPGPWCTIRYAACAFS